MVSCTVNVTVWWDKDLRRESQIETEAWSLQSIGHGLRWECSRKLIEEITGEHRPESTRWEGRTERSWQRTRHRVWGRRSPCWRYSWRDTRAVLHGLILHGKTICVCLQMHDITTEIFRAWRHSELTYYYLKWSFWLLSNLENEPERDRNDSEVARGTVQ